MEILVGNTPIVQELLFFAFQVSTTGQISGSGTMQLSLIIQSDQCALETPGSISVSMTYTVSGTLSGGGLLGQPKANIASFTTVNKGVPASVTITGCELKNCVGNGCSLVDVTVNIPSAVASFTTKFSLPLDPHSVAVGYHPAVNATVTSPSSFPGFVTYFTFLNFYNTCILRNVQGQVMVTTSSGVTQGYDGMKVTGLQVKTGTGGSAAVVCTDGTSEQLKSGVTTTIAQGLISFVCTGVSSVVVKFVVGFYTGGVGTLIQAVACKLFLLLEKTGNSPGLVSLQLNNGTLTVMDFDGVVKVGDNQTGASVLLNASQEIALNVNGGTSQQTMTNAVTTFNPSSVSQWWIPPSQLDNSSQSTTTATAASSSSQSTSTTSTGSNNQTTSMTTISTASSNSSNGDGAGIPDFPYQPLAAAVLTALIAVSYVVVRRSRFEHTA